MSISPRKFKSYMEIIWKSHSGDFDFVPNKITFTELVDDVMLFICQLENYKEKFDEDWYNELKTHSNNNINCCQTIKKYLHSINFPTKKLASSKLFRWL